MPSPGSTAGSTARLTSRGEATRSRIVQSAAELMYTRGVGATTLDDVREASGTSKSQLYRHFADKDRLVEAVIDLKSAEVLAREEKRLATFDSISGLKRWRNAIVEQNALNDGAYGCVLGSMANEVADHNEKARVELAATFDRWQGLLADGLRRMKRAGVLEPRANPNKLAVGIMAALQGGYLLAQTAHDIAPMKTALDMAISHVESFTSS